jgi:putative transposase
VDNKQFTLLVPIEKEKDILNNNDWICIDPGIRTFLNCKTNKGYIEIGKNLSNKLKTKIKLLDKQDKINKETLSNKLKEKIKNIKNIKNYIKEKQCCIRKKIKNWIDDTHWKIIDYLTSSYKNIVIGKWSTKSIIRKDDSVLTSLTKRVAQNLSFYKFLQRLQYKCKIRENSLRIQDEWYTSKTCSVCGCKNENLGGSKIFNCNKCKINMDRDYNGARNIMLKSISSINIVS